MKFHGVLYAEQRPRPSPRGTLAPRARNLTRSLCPRAVAASFPFPFRFPFPHARDGVTFTKAASLPRPSVRPLCIWQRYSPPDIARSKYMSVGRCGYLMPRKKKRVKNCPKRMRTVEGEVAERTCCARCRSRVKEF